MKFSMRVFSINGDTIACAVVKSSVSIPKQHSVYYQDLQNLKRHKNYFFTMIGFIDITQISILFFKAMLTKIQICKDVSTRARSDPKFGLRPSRTENEGSRITDICIFK